MNTNLQKLIEYFSNKPKSLFLLDGIGAALTCLCLFLAFSFFDQYLGFPTKMLRCLAIMGLFYGFYSITCYFLLRSNWSTFLNIIATANSLYCLVLLLLLIWHKNTLTILGLTYFTLECVIIALLAYIELSVSINLKKKRDHDTKHS